MHAVERALPEAVDIPLDAWLRQTLHQSFGATLFEPLPADLLALAGDQPPSSGLQMPVRNQQPLSPREKARDGL